MQIEAGLQISWEPISDNKKNLTLSAYPFHSHLFLLSFSSSPSFTFHLTHPSLSLPHPSFSLPFLPLFLISFLFPPLFPSISPLFPLASASFSLPFDCILNILNIIFALIYLFFFLSFSSSFLLFFFSFSLLFLFFFFSFLLFLGIAEPERRLDCQQATKLGRTYKHALLYLQSTNSDKHLPQCPFTGQYFSILLWCLYSYLSMMSPLYRVVVSPPPILIRHSDPPFVSLKKDLQRLVVGAT